MTTTHESTSTAAWTAPSLLRQPVVDPSGVTVAYAARVLVPGARFESDPVEPTTAQLAAVQQEIAVTDLEHLSAGQPVILQVVPGMLADGAPALDPARVHLEVPGFMAGDPTSIARVEAAIAGGSSLVVGNFINRPEQAALLGLADLVKVDARRPDLDTLVALAHAAGVRVVAEQANTAALQRRAFAAGADLVQGPWHLPDIPETAGEMSVGEVQALQLLDLLSEEPLDIDAVTGLIATEPGLSIGVLRLVNSSAFALRQRIDSVRRATVLVGPRRLRSLAVTSLAGAGSTSVDDLWVVLTRALTLWDLRGDDSGYTAGLLSAVADLRHFSSLWLVALSGVSDDVASALAHGGGRTGALLAAVRAHEAGEPAGVLAAGLDPHTVSRAWQVALPEALGIAQALGS